MPYIDHKARLRLDREGIAGKRDLIHVIGTALESAGELNYVVFRLIKLYLEKNGTNYQNMNDIVGALDNCKDEFRRRIQHPYEDEKIEQNGDV
jgi:hypothetical protein